MISPQDISQRLDALKCVVLVPTYNNDGTIRSVIESIKPYASQIMVVDDGSTDRTDQILRSMDGIIHIGYKKNRGKGYAIRTALREASLRQFRYLLSIDADGQHYPEDIATFVAFAEKEPDTLLIGARCLTAENMPSKNTFANKFSNFWYRVETGCSLDDTQSGFRLYPLAKLGKMRFFTSRYEFEVEVIVRAAWKGIPVKNIPIKVYYPPQEERVSHFRPGADFTRISMLNTVLVTWALTVYYPFRFLKWLRWSNLKRFFEQHILHTLDSNHTMACSIAWGVVWGMMPVWGWQGIIAVATGHFLRLNKVVCFAATNISIPPMIPLILFGGYALGCVVLGHPIHLSLHDITLQTVQQSLVEYLIGSITLAFASGAFSYLLFRLFFILFHRRG